MSVTIEQAKVEAISMVEDSMSKDCMFSCSDMPDDEVHDWKKGDPENPHTIAMLTGCEGFESHSFDDGVEIIKAHILEKFPQFSD